jgi:hypothetical protein
MSPTRESAFLEASFMKIMASFAALIACALLAGLPLAGRGDSSSAPPAGESQFEPLPPPPAGAPQEPGPEGEAPRGSFIPANEAAEPPRDETAGTFPAALKEPKLNPGQKSLAPGGPDPLEGRPPLDGRAPPDGGACPRGPEPLKGLDQPGSQALPEDQAASGSRAAPERQASFDGQAPFGDRPPPKRR